MRSARSATVGNTQKSVAASAGARRLDIIFPLAVPHFSARYSVTDAKPVAKRIDELEREAADVEDISPLAIRGAFERLAALARRLADRAEAAERERDEARERMKTAKEVVEGLLHQFAYDATGPALWTGGLSALEDGFTFMEWDDPYPIPGLACDEPGCIKRRTCGWPSPAGYRHTCGDHMAPL